MGFPLEPPEGTKPADTEILVFVLLCFLVFFFFFLEHNEMMGFKTTWSWCCPVCCVLF